MNKEASNLLKAASLLKSFIEDQKQVKNIESGVERLKKAGIISPKNVVATEDLLQDYSPDQVFAALEVIETGMGLEKNASSSLGEAHYENNGSSIDHSENRFAAFDAMLMNM